MLACVRAQSEREVGGEEGEEKKEREGLLR